MAMELLKRRVKRIFKVEPEGEGIYKYASFKGDFFGDGGITISEDFVGLSFYKVGLYISISYYSPTDDKEINKTGKHIVLFMVERNEKRIDKEQYCYFRTLIKYLIKLLSIEGYLIFVYSDGFPLRFLKGVEFVKNADDFLRKAGKEI